MTKITRFFALIFLLATIGCDKQDYDQSFPAENTQQKLLTDQPVEPEKPAVERKLITEGRVGFETPSIDSSRNAVLRAVNKYGGYVSSDQAYNSPGRTTVTMVVRIPAGHFDDLLREATAGIKKFDSKEIDVKDVTEEYLDIEARLKTKKALEARYAELLKKANTVTEILEIEKQGGELRVEIESIEGRMKYLENRVSFSTLTLTFYESTPLDKSFGKKFAQGFKNGWENLILFFVFLVNIWPFVLLLVAVIVGLRMNARRKKNT
ncbi:MAG: DUF4349 domain-containing protein [Bacteroidia bacterium]